MPTFLIVPLLMALTGLHLSSTSVMHGRPRIAHFAPSWRGDRPWGIRKTARRRAGHRFIDMNFQVVWIDPHSRGRGFRIYCLHWRDPRRNRYRWIKVGGRCRRMTRAELRRPVDDWSAAEVARWRRTRNPRSERPLTYAYLARYAQARGVTICAELKHRAFAEPQVARQFVAAARRAGHPAWAMALYHLPDCLGKSKAIQDAGGQFAVIFGTFRADRARFAAARHTWPVQPSSVW